MKNSDNFILVVSFLFLTTLPFSKSLSLYYNMSFRNISCNTFTIRCYKHNQHFTVTQKSNNFC